MDCVLVSLNVSNVFYILPDSGQNPRNIQFSFAAPHPGWYTGHNIQHLMVLLRQVDGQVLSEKSD